MNPKRKEKKPSQICTKRKKNAKNTIEHKRDVSYALISKYGQDLPYIEVMLICSYMLLQVILITELFFTELGHFLKERKMTILLKKTKKLKKKMMMKRKAKKVVGRKKKQKRKRKRNRNMDLSNRPQGKNTLLLEILLLSKLGTLHLR